jgi:hypothetical protein
MHKMPTDITGQWSSGPNRGQWALRVECFGRLGRADIWDREQDGDRAYGTSGGEICLYEFRQVLHIRPAPVIGAGAGGQGGCRRAVSAKT